MSHYGGNGVAVARYPVKVLGGAQVSYITPAPVVYRSGHQILNLVSGVRFSIGAQLLTPSDKYGTLWK